MKEQALLIYQQYKIVIVSVVMIFSCVVLMVFGIIPQLKSLLDSQKTFEKITGESQTLEVKAKDLETLESSGLENKVDIVLFSLPSEKDYPSTLNVLQQVATTNNFKLTDVAISQSLGGSSKAQGFGIKAEVAGPKGSLDNLLDSIDKAPKVMKISSIEVSNPKNSDTIVAILGIDVFFAPIPNKLGSIDSVLPKLTEKDNELLSNLTKSVPVNTGGETFVPSPKGKSNPFE